MAIHGKFPVNGRRLVFDEHTGKLLTELLDESGLLGLWGMAIAFGVIYNSNGYT